MGNLNTIIKFLTALFFAVFFIHVAHAQPSANKTITIVTNIPVGASVEVTVRKISDLLSKKWNQPVVVLNRPGAGGIIAIEHFLQQPDDGTTILYGDFGAVTLMPTLYKKEYIYDELRPITSPLFGNWVLFTSPNIKNIDELKDTLRKQPRYSSWGVGSGGHICGAEVTELLGIDNVEHVPYKDFSSWFVDVSNGLVPFGCATMGWTESFVKSGKLKWLAVAGDRDLVYKDVPTIRELTGKDLQVNGGWPGFFVHRSVNDQFAAKLEKDLIEIIKTPEIQNQIFSIRHTPTAWSSKEMSRRLARDRAFNKQVSEKLKISIN